MGLHQNSTWIAPSLLPHVSVVSSRANMWWLLQICWRRANVFLNWAREGFTHSFISFVFPFSLWAWMRVRKQEGRRCYCGLGTGEKGGGQLHFQNWPPPKNFLQPLLSYFWKDSEKDITSLIKHNSISLLLQVIIFLEPIFILLG